MVNGLVESAFKLNWRFGDSGGSDDIARERSESGEGPFIHFGGEVGGSLVHSVGHGAGDEIDDKLAGGFDVGVGVLRL